MLALSVEDLRTIALAVTHILACFSFKLAADHLCPTSNLGSDVDGGPGRLVAGLGVRLPLPCFGGGLHALG